MLRSLPAKTSVNDPREEALDCLIDQYQRLFALYDARRSSAEAKAAGILTATVAVAALTATAASLVKHVNIALAVVLVVLLVISVICAIYAASAAGLRGPRHREDPAKTNSPCLSTESAQYRDAARALNATAEEILRACQDATNEALTVRVRTLELWKERQLDAHHLAQRKDLGAAYAGITLGLALACGAAIVVLIVTHSG
jgi:low affinity Fe/Cu permease